MAFSSGTVTTLAGFLDLMCLFAVANAGFTERGTATSVTIPISGNDHSGVTDAVVRKVSKGDVYYHFATSENLREITTGKIQVRLCLMRMAYADIATSGTMSDTVPTGQLRNSKFGAYLSTEPASPAMNYFFFTDGLAVHGVLEVFSGVFTHVSFGSVEKFGTFEGGEYVTAFCAASQAPTYTNAGGDVIPFPERRSGNGNFSTNSRNGFIRLGNTGTTFDFALMGNGTVPVGYKYASGFLFVGLGNNASFVAEITAFIVNAPDAFTERSPIAPAVMYVQNQSVTYEDRYVLGQVGNFGLINMTDFSPGDIVATDWQVFPLGQKSGDTSIGPVTNELGLAYRRV